MVKKRLTGIFLILLCTSLSIGVGCSGKGFDLLDGWMVYEGPGFEIQLPGTYIGGANASTFPDLVTFAQNNGYDEIAAWIAGQELSSTYLFLALDTHLQDWLTMVNIFVEDSEILSNYTAEAYADVVVEGIVKQGFYTLDERNEIPVETYDCVHLSYFVEPQEDGGEIYPYIDKYFIQTGDHLWIIQFIANGVDRPQRIIDFDRSAQSFREVR